MQFPLLITGVAGVIGYNALDYFLTRYPGEVVGVRQGTRGDIAPAPGVVFADVDDAVELERLFEKYQFKSVIHSGGSCALKACQLNPELAWTLNLSTILSMLAQCERYNSRLICMSVDLVFKGRPAGEFYKESDPPDAVSIYGQSMSAAENLILLHRPQTCILR
ncbi:MAG: sugar nucleotide-binding protein, partial [Thermoguttaceae bacterium]|nr:sugar nucleotide-binding protein [Thermoguttaceae bacterium]